MLNYYNPEKIFTKSIKLNGFELYDDLMLHKVKIKEIRLYTDTTKTKIYKPQYIAKINKLISENNELEISNLPKRIRNEATNNIRIKFIYWDKEDENTNTL